MERVRRHTVPTDRVELIRRQFVCQRRERDFILSLEGCFSGEECSSILSSTFDYVNEYSWSTKRHTAYPTRDVAVRNLPALRGDFINHLVELKVLPHICKETGFMPSDLYVVDLFVVNYEAHIGQKGLATHTDGCLISFNVLLNDSAEFEGGGTMINSSLYRLERGGCIVHDAKLPHSGVPISRGQRLILVGFLESKRRNDLFKKSVP